MAQTQPEVDVSDLCEHLSISFWCHGLAFLLYPDGREASVEAWREHTHLLKTSTLKWYMLLLFISH